MDENQQTYDINNIPMFSDEDLNDVLELEEVENIDMGEIDESSKIDANKIISSAVELYANKEFMENNPKLKQRIETELESLRILLKMRKADEITHDILIKAIAQKPSNASLYRSMTEVQKTILSITSDISKTLSGLENMVKHYQTELIFEEHNDPDDSEDSNSAEDNNMVHRGSKEFIQQILEGNKKGDQ